MLRGTAPRFQLLSGLTKSSSSMYPQRISVFSRLTGTGGTLMLFLACMCWVTSDSEVPIFRYHIGMLSTWQTTRMT